MNKKLLQLGLILGGASLLTLHRVAQHKQQVIEEKPKYNLQKAKRSNKYYFTQRPYEQSLEDLQDAFKTNAGPESEEFFDAVYKFQKGNNLDTDGICGPQTFKKALGKTPQQWSREDKARRNKEESSEKQSFKSPKELGLIDLSKFVRVKEHNTNPFAHPAFVELISNISNNADFKFWRVTEAYPPTVKHRSKTHYNGKAIDFTLKDPRLADTVVAWINSQGSFWALNEYKVKTKFQTGGHIHVEYRGG